MLDWNPALYLRFANERTRPAAELLARVPLEPARVRHVVDLGCGPGNSTELLVQRFVDAHITGVDNSSTMLEAARQSLPQVDFFEADMASWQPAANAAAPDLIYANASVQWVGAHEQLIPRWLEWLAPGGVLAIQMPDNLHEPSHRLMREVAALPEFVGYIGQADQTRTAILPIGAYYDLLSASGVPVASVDVWHTVYQHPMESASSIVQWLRSTGLKPYLEGLPAPLQASFLAEYERRIAQAYPVRADGKCLLAFPRLFLVAQRQA